MYVGGRLLCAVCLVRNSEESVDMMHIIYGCVKIHIFIISITYVYTHSQKDIEKR